MNTEQELYLARATRAQSTRILFSRPLAHIYQFTPVNPARKVAKFYTEATRQVNLGCGKRMIYLEQSASYRGNRIGLLGLSTFRQQMF